MKYFKYYPVLVRMQKLLSYIKAFSCLYNQEQVSPASQVASLQLTISQSDLFTFSDTVRSTEMDDPHMGGHQIAADDDPLPAVEDLQISGEAFPGRELQACGYSINGTISCNFEWVRHLEDGSLSFIDGAKQPNYLVSADDVDTYLAIEVQPMDDRKRKGELVKVFANDNRKITCDPEIHNIIRKSLHAGQAVFRVSHLAGFDIWEPATLLVKNEGFSIKITESSNSLVREKFSPATVVSVTCGHPTEFSIIGSGGVKDVLRAENTPEDISCSRDTIVLTLRLFIMMAANKKKGKKKAYMWGNLLKSSN